jgi:endo-1,4-beta-D-glucanase Y
MMAAAYMGDKEAVDGLYAFYQSKTSNGACGMMDWTVSCGGVTSTGSATDGDIDLGVGLLVAHWQWPTLGYDEKLRGVLDKASVLLMECNGVTALYPGCGGGTPYGGCQETDISYYQPAFFRYFADISGDDRWAKLADDTNRVRDAAAHPTTGLVPDWQTVDGSNYTGGRNTTYAFDAIRTAFKHGLDYLWNGTPAVQVWCEKLTSWLYNEVGVANIKDGYNLDGSSPGANHNLAHVGSVAVCAGANTQEIVDAFVEEAGKLTDNYWYGDYLGNLYLLAISGNMWNPDIVNKK